MRPELMGDVEGTAMRASMAYRSEQRFHALAQSVVARAIHAHGPIDPEHADEDAYRIALDATVILLQTIYEGDAEIMALRGQLEAYKKYAEASLSLTPGINLVFSTTEVSLTKTQVNSKPQEEPQEP